MKRNPGRFSACAYRGAPVPGSPACARRSPPQLADHSSLATCMLGRGAVGGRFSGRLAGPAAGLERQLPTQGGQSASTADEQEFRGSGRWISDSERAVPLALQSFRFAQDRSRRRTLGDPGPHHVSTWISTIGGHAPSTQKMHRDWRGRPLLRAGSHIKSWQKIRRHERQLGRSWEQ